MLGKYEKKNRLLSGGNRMITPTENKYFEEEIAKALRMLDACKKEISELNSKIYTLENIRRKLE